VERRYVFPDRAGEVSGNSVAAAFKGETAFANGCKPPKTMVQLEEGVTQLTIAVQSDIK
jgi:hypothetical protein